MSGGRVVNLTGTGKITTTRSGQANVVTVNPKTLQLTAIKGSSGTTGIFFHVQKIIVLVLSMFSKVDITVGCFVPS